MVYSNVEEWLDGLKPELREDVRTIIGISAKYFDDRRDFFRNCGFYAVGSSLNRPDFRDIDLVLVGLDFRQVFAYDEGFLDPEVAVRDMFDPSDPDFKLDCMPEYYCQHRIKQHGEIEELAGIIVKETDYGIDDFGTESNVNPFRGLPYISNCLR